MFLFNSELQRGWDVYHSITAGKPNIEQYYNNKKQKLDYLPIISRTHTKCIYFDGKESKYSGKPHTHSILASYSSLLRERNAEADMLAIRRAHFRSRQYKCTGCRDVHNKRYGTECAKCKTYVEIKHINTVAYYRYRIKYYIYKRNIRQFPIQCISIKCYILGTPLDTCKTLCDYISAHITFKDFDIPMHPIIKTHKRSKREEIKLSFRNYLFKNKIMNSKHYDIELSESEELRQIELEMNTADLESSKKTIFRQVYLQERYKSPLQNRITQSTDQNKLGALTFLLMHIAHQNSTTVTTIKKELCNFIFNKNNKKKGLILCGPSDSGKLFVANLLYSLFKPYEIGYFNCPTGPNPSPFLLQSLTNSIAYRCDEMVFEHLGVIQMIKQLLEGSHTLTTDVKYKDSMTIDAHPTIITMNATSKHDIKMAPNRI